MNLNKAELLIGEFSHVTAIIPLFIHTNMCLHTHNSSDLLCPPLLFLFADTYCWSSHAIKAAYLDGVLIPFSSARNVINKVTYTTLKVTNLGIKSAGALGAAGKQLCFEVTNSCNSFASLCAGGLCRYALTDISKKCCPTSKLV
jgi:hypothetical protein